LGIKFIFKKNEILSMKKTILFIIICLQSFSIWSQEVKFVTRVNQVVELNEQFRLTFAVNAQGSAFKAPDLSTFNYSGPSTSTSSSYQFINGKTTQNFENSYVYFMMPKKTGKFTIGSAQITIDGKVYKTEPVTIEVVSGSTAGNNNNSNSGNSNQTNTSTTETGDVFVTLNLSKNSVYQGEHLVASVQIYTRETLRGFNDIKLPSYQGFWSQEIPTANNIQLQRANYNGKVYDMGVIHKSLLFPQQSGTINIEPVQIEAIVRKVIDRRSIWGAVYDDVIVKLKSQVKNLIVKPLPEGKPASFNGAVGNFEFSAKFDKTELKANDAAKLTINISGGGNLKLIDPLKVGFPPDFEVYDPQVNSNIKNTVDGAKGSTTIEYVVIPRVGGEFVIPAIEFSYFDPQKGIYVSKKSEEFHFKIEKSDEDGTGNQNAVSFTKKDIQLMGNDIRHIKENRFELVKSGNTFFGTLNFYLAYILILFVFGIVFVLKRKQIKQNSDIVSVKNRKAHKISEKRLKLAKKYLEENKKEPFYDEILRAMWGYVSDKLNIPPSQLTRDTILDIFRTKKVSDELSSKFISVLDACEYAKYAPAGQADMQAVYKNASDTIQSMEQFI
jgi:hypothetical protein